VSLEEQTCRTRLRELSFYPSPQGAFGACRVTAGWSCLAANGASTSFAANGNLALHCPHPRVSFAYFERALAWPMCPPFRSPAAPSASFTVPEVPNLADAGNVQPALRERSDCPTGLVLERQALRLLPTSERCCWDGGLEEAPAHNAARRGSTSSRLAAMMLAGQGSRQWQP
jgi:hypothetical protein